MDLICIWSNHLKRVHFILSSLGFISNLSRIISFLIPVLNMLPLIYLSILISAKFICWICCLLTIQQLDLQGLVGFVDVLQNFPFSIVRPLLSHNIRECSFILTNLFIYIHRKLVIHLFKLDSILLPPVTIFSYSHLLTRKSWKTSKIDY